MGSADGTYSISWEEFLSLAEEIEDSQSDTEVVPWDLVVVGRNLWWLERSISRGRAKWVLKSMPRRVGASLPIEDLLGKGAGVLSTVKGNNPYYLRRI